MKICRLCEKPFKDYQNKNRNRCGSCNTKIRRFRAKAAAIKYLGEKCAKCGWQGDQAALEFHHKNFREKDFIIGNAANKKWENIKQELERCALLCANCHAIAHTSKRSAQFIKEALSYKGRGFKF